MWGNISGVVGKALEQVQKLSNELETQMDEAVGKAIDDINNPDNTTSTDNLPLKSIPNEQMISENLVVVNNDDTLFMNNKEQPVVKSTKKINKDKVNIALNDNKTITSNDEIIKLKSEYENNLNEINIKHANEINVYENKINEFNNQIKNHNDLEVKRVNELTQDIASKDYKISELTDKINKLTTKLKERITNDLDKENKCNIIIKENNDLKNKLNDINNELTNKNQLYIDLEKKSNQVINELQHENENHSIKINENEIQYNNMIKSHHELENKIQSLLIQINTSSSGNNDYDLLRDQLNIEINELTNKISTKDQELNLYKEESIKKIQLITNELNHIKTQLNNNNDIILVKDSELSKLKEQYDLIIIDNNNKNTQINELINDLNIKNDNITLINQQLLEYQDNSNKELIELKNIIELKDKDIHQYILDINEFKDIQSSKESNQQDINQFDIKITGIIRIYYIYIYYCNV